MKNRLLTLFALIAGFLLVSVPLAAHHGQAAYDLTKKITLKGTVTNFVLVNPHSIFSFDAADDQGKVKNWTMELSTPLMLMRIGWTKTILKPGDAVTVTFSGLASYPDIRILEYSGIDTVNPVDTFAGAIGNSATSSNVSLQTTAAADLLVAGNTVQSSSIAGSGFTLRLTTSPDGDIAEDKIATTAGTYSASATLSATSGWGPAGG